MTTIEKGPEGRTYSPVHVDGELDTTESRWVWLFKWLLGIPHYVVLFFLWVAFAVLSVVAFFAILFTGRYPRGIFDFNVGVLRWSWRVSYYAYGALGTDRYPPFSLHDVPDYPAHLSVDYPERLSRGLVLVKWWLLAIPHYLVVAFLLGGGWFAAREGVRGDDSAVWQGGLIGLLVLFAGIALLFTGRYPRPLFDLVLGLNRWVLRVAAYVALMTDAYPPFRLDQGAHEPGSPGPQVVASGPTSPSAPSGYRPGQAGQPGYQPGQAVQPGYQAGQAGQPGYQPGQAVQPGYQPGQAVQPGYQPGQPGDQQWERRPWTAGRVVTVVVGALFVIAGLGVGAGGAALGLADAGLRDDAGYVTSGDTTLTTSTYALSSQNLELHAEGAASAVPHDLLGDIKVTARSDDPGTPIFLGVAPTSDVRAYLAGVEHDTVTDLTGDGATYDTTPGGAPASTPSDQGFWTESSEGTGTRSVVWEPRNGDWTLVVMPADGSRGVQVDMSVGATLPALGWLAAALLVTAALLAGIGIVMVVLALTVRPRPGAMVPAQTPRS